jgi:poly(3-hydroxybutyrate) depolymerase
MRLGTGFSFGHPAERSDRQARIRRAAAVRSFSRLQGCGRPMRRRPHQRLPTRAHSARTEKECRVSAATIHGTLLDHLVSAGQQRFRDGKAERLGGLDVDGQLDFYGLIDRQIGWFLAFETVDPRCDTCMDAKAFTDMVARSEKPSP